MPSSPPQIPEAAVEAAAATFLFGGRVFEGDRLLARDALQAAYPHLLAAFEKEHADDDVITVYRRMKAAADGARAERDIMRAAVEAIAGGWKPAQDRARRALEEDRKRRERNLAADEGMG
jgi:hypothetical protein